MKSGWLRFMLGPLAVLSACEEPIPVNPGFENDVRPIFLARCVRCHGAGGMLNDDPLIPEYGAPSNSFLGEYDAVLTGCPGPMDPPQPASATCHQGASNVVKTITFYIHSTGAARMPPPPSPPLTDREMAIVDAWASKMPPAR